MSKFLFAFFLTVCVTAAPGLAGTLFSSTSALKAASLGSTKTIGYLADGCPLVTCGACTAQIGSYPMPMYASCTVVDCNGQVSSTYQQFCGYEY